jgi:hypothetical protein
MVVSCAAQAPMGLAKRGTAVEVPVEARCEFTPTHEARHNCCVMQPYSTAMPVEVAYAAVAAEYGFSAQPQAYDVEAEAYPIHYGHWHDAQPGGLYRLGGIVVPRSSPALFRGVWLGVTLTSQGPANAEVRPVYCEHSGQAMANQLAWHRAVQQSVFQTLPPTQWRP